MSVLRLNLTEDEVVALGYALGSGLKAVANRSTKDATSMRNWLNSLADKISKGWEKEGTNERKRDRSKRPT